MSARDRAPDPFEHGLPVLDGVGRAEARIRLRAPRQPADDDGADLEALWTVFSDVRALRYWSREPFEAREQAAEYLAGIARGLATGALFQWAVADAATDALIGTVTLLAWDRTHRRCELGFILGHDWWGRGLASEAVRAALGFAFSSMDVHRVEADVDPENGASLRLLRRLGFREEGRLAERWFTYGEWRDTALLGLLARDYAAALSAAPSGGHSPN